MATMQTIVDDSAIEIGILVAGGSLPTNDQAWVLRKLHYFLKTLGRDGFNLPVKVRDEPLTLINDQASYTIGKVGGEDFDTEMPHSLDFGFVRINDTDYHVRLRPRDEYSRLSNKNTRKGRPYYMYYDYGAVTGTITFFPKPNQNFSFFLTSNKYFTTPGAIDGELIVPPEYEEMLVTNLAVRIAGRYGRNISSQTKLTAMQTLMDIRSDKFTGNMKGKYFMPSPDHDDIDGRSTYDIHGDTYK
ncbi:MAG: hypothetical protein DRH93_11670 [Deltaproteobacteria bacterium]|nr:MAG: hypothetical protein DRH93_11670 [Deltaproteobacteria bacterium]